MALEKEKESYKEGILNCLSPLVLEMRTNNTYGERMIINAAFLVEDNREVEFDQKIQELDAEYGERVKFKYVGTLPPFNFVNLIIDTLTPLTINGERSSALTPESLDLNRDGLPFDKLKENAST